MFTDYGDCNPNNVGSKIIPHLIRMASTRVKARVMKDFCNIGMCSFEELNPDKIDEEPATLNQIILNKKLASKVNAQVDYNSLDKTLASALINELAEKKKA